MDPNLQNYLQSPQDIFGESQLSQLGGSGNPAKKNLDMDGFRIQNLGNAVESQDAVNFGQMNTAIQSAIDPGSGLFPSLSDINTAKPLNGNLDLRSGSYQVLVNAPTQSDSTIRLADLNTAIDTETQARIASDQNLQDQINAIQPGTGDVTQAQLDAEILARTNADTSLQNQILSLQADKFQIRSILNDNSVQALSNRIETKFTDQLRKTEQYDALQTPAVYQQIYENRLDIVTKSNDIHLRQDKAIFPTNNIQTVYVSRNGDENADVASKIEIFVDDALSQHLQIGTSHTSNTLAQIPVSYIQNASGYTQQTLALSGGEISTDPTLFLYTDAHSSAISQLPLSINAKMGYETDQIPITDPRQLTSKKYVDDQITTEQTARQNADNTLQQNIDNEESARISFDDAIDARVTTIEQNANRIFEGTSQLRINANKEELLLENTLKRTTQQATGQPTAQTQEQYEDRVSIISKQNQITLNGTKQIDLNPTSINLHSVNVTCTDNQSANVLSYLNIQPSGLQNQSLSIGSGHVIDPNTLQMTKISYIQNDAGQPQESLLISAGTVNSDASMIMFSDAHATALSQVYPIQFNRAVGYTANPSVDITELQQFATKQYVDDNAGGTVDTQNLIVNSDLDYQGAYNILADDPTLAQHVATKIYVDNAVAGGSTTPSIILTQESIASGQTYVLDHNLNLTFDQLNIRALLQIKTASGGFSVGDYSQPCWDNFVGSTSGSGGGFTINDSVTDKLNQIRVSMGNNPDIQFIGRNGGINGVSYNNVRLILYITQDVAPKILQSNAITSSNLIINGNINMGANKVTSTATPTNPEDYITKSYGDANYTTGGTIANLNAVPSPISAYSFANQRLTNLATPSASSDACTKFYADSLISNYEPELIRNITNQNVQVVCTNSLIDCNNNIIRGITTPGTNSTDAVSVAYLDQQLQSGLSTGRLQSSLSPLVEFGFTDTSSAQNNKNLVYTNDGTFPVQMCLQQCKLLVGSVSYDSSSSGTLSTLQIIGEQGGGSVCAIDYGENTSDNIMRIGQPTDVVNNFNSRVLCHTNIRVAGNDQRPFMMELRPWDLVYVYDINAQMSVISPALEWSIDASSKIRCSSLVQTNPSSIEYKRDIKQFARDDMREICPVTYYYKDDCENVQEWQKNKEHVGYIYEHVPERFRLNQNGQKKVDISSIQNELIASQQIRIRELETRLQTLEQLVQQIIG